MKDYRRFFVTILIIVLISSMLSLISPICLHLWGEMNVSLDNNRILILIGILIVSNLLNVVIIVGRERFAKHYNIRNFANMISDFLHMDYDAIIEEGPSNMLEKIVTATNQIYIYMTGMHIQIWSSAIIALICTVLVLSVNLILGITMLLYALVSYSGYKLINKELAKRSQHMQEETGKGFQELISYLKEPDYYKQLPDYEPLLAKMLPAAERIYGSMSQVNEFAQSASTALQGLGTIFQSAVMMLTVFSFYQGEASPFFLMTVTIILPLYVSAVSTITNSNVQKIDYTIARDLHGKIIGRAEDTNGITLDTVNSLEINVSKLVVAGHELPFFANTTMKKGDIGQVSGASGTGKSTFSKALVRFRGVDSVKINGKNLSDYSVSSLRKKIEYVSQNIPIINGTMRDNIFFGKEMTVSDDLLLNSPYLRSLFTSKSLDTQILEGGANLSGGEKQKIALVRALLNDPEILILDEVCSNIDSEMSNEIYLMLDNNRAKMITIIITHDRLPEGLINVEING